jgi:RNA polymerase sigma factor (sigma-70 family)
MSNSNWPKQEGVVEQTRGGAPSQPAGGVASRADRRKLEEGLRAACAALYEEHKDSVSREITRWLRAQTDPSLVSDIHQEVFAKVCKRVHEGRAVPPEAGEQLLTLARNEVRIQTRSRARQRVDGEPVEEEVPASRPGPVEQYESAEEEAMEKEVMDLTLARMRPEWAVAMRMVYFGGMSYADAAAQLGCSEEALHGRLQRARWSFVEEGRRVVNLLQGSRRPPRR